MTLAMIRISGQANQRQSMVRCMHHPGGKKKTKKTSEEQDQPFLNRTKHMICQHAFPHCFDMLPSFRLSSLT